MFLTIERRARLITTLAVTVLLTASIIPGPWTATAAAETKIARVTKNALYGAGLGLLLGAATALVVDSDKRDDSIRWGLVLGTFAGFGYGVYTIAAGEDDEFFMAETSPAGTTPGFDPRVHFVGTHGFWVKSTTQEDAVTRSSGLLSGPERSGDHNHAEALLPTAD